MSAVDVPFADAARAARALTTLAEAFLVSGSVLPLEDFSNGILKSLLVSPDPDRALTNLLRYAEVVPGRAALFDDLTRYPVQRDVLLTVMGGSQYFADVLVRDPGLFRWLTTTDALSVSPTADMLAREVDRIAETFKTSERRIDALKRLHRREILRIGARDLLGHVNVRSTTADLSLLADVIVEAVLREAAQQLGERYADAPAAPLAVIGLGKLGGVELNYSSDIDVLFVYGDESASRRGRAKGRPGKVTADEYFNRLCERAIALLSQPTHEGYFYRVDIRLRPESGAGSIARSMESTVQYYESRGEIWERQMLIKARVVAGDRDFGHHFLESLISFVYPRTFFSHPAESIARIKSRIEAAVDGERNVKLMPGGIRDIEFIVQALQLLNGGRHPSIRSGNTLHAIESLHGEGLLSIGEANALRAAYELFRLVEHRLQMQLYTQSHTLPEGGERLDTLARQCRMQTGAELDRALNEHFEAVRAIFTQVLSIGESRLEGGIMGILDGGLSEKSMAQLFSSYGFRDHRIALKNIRTLTTGSPLAERRELDTRTRDVFREIAPTLFNDIRGTPDPDLTLAGITAVAAGQRFPSYLYGLLQDSRFRRLLTDICSASPRFARAIASRPLFLESLATDAAALAPLSPVETGRKDLIEAKDSLELRAGIRNILGLSTLGEMTRELSDIADAVVRRVTEHGPREGSKGGPKDLAVFAVGKFGTRELMFDADLDLLFVGGPDTRKGNAEIQRRAAAIVRTLSSVSERGRLYDVDVRLRPEGRNAPLVVDRGQLLRYLRERASLWERQSMTRLRFVSGDVILGRSIIEAVNLIVYDSPLPVGWVDAIVAMRRKMETRTRVAGTRSVDLKVGPGGLVDIEFIAQMIQLLLGKSDIGFRGLTATATIDRGSGTPFLQRRESEFLVSAYTFLRTIEKLMRITLEQRGSLLPANPALDTLARHMGTVDGKTLRDRVTETMRQVRALFLEISQRLSRISP